MDASCEKTGKKSRSRNLNLWILLSDTPYERFRLPKGWVDKANDADEVYSVYNEDLRYDLEDEDPGIYRSGLHELEKLSRLTTEQLEQKVSKKLAQLQNSSKFNAQDCIADANLYEHYSRYGLWTIEEAAALAVGRNPKKLTIKNIKYDETSRHLVETVREFQKIYWQLQRKNPTGEITKAITPKEFFSWASKYRVKLPEALNSQFKKQPVSELHPKTRAVLLKIILGMAMAKYGFDSDPNKQTVASKIFNDLELKQISVDEDTIRKYLVESKGHAPDKGMK